MFNPTGKSLVWKKLISVCPVLKTAHIYYPGLNLFLFVTSVPPCLTWTAGAPLPHVLRKYDVSYYDPEWHYVTGGGCTDSLRINHLYAWKSNKYWLNVMQDKGNMDYIGVFSANTMRVYSNTYSYRLSFSSALYWNTRVETVWLVSTPHPKACYLASPP